MKMAVCWERYLCLTSESVQGTSLAFQGIDNVHGSDSLPLGMLSVCHSISDHILQEDLEDTSSFFIDETWDTLYSASASQSTDGRLRDTLDIVTQNLSVTLGASLSKSFSSFTTSRHLDLRKFVREISARKYSRQLWKNEAESRSIRQEISERWRRHLWQPIRIDFLNTSVHKHTFMTFFFNSEDTFFAITLRHSNIFTYFLRSNPTAEKI